MNNTTWADGPSSPRRALIAIASRDELNSIIDLAVANSANKHNAVKRRRTTPNNLHLTIGLCTNTDDGSVPEPAIVSSRRKPPATKRAKAAAQEAGGVGSDAYMDGGKLKKKEQELKRVVNFLAPLVAFPALGLSLLLRLP